MKIFYKSVITGWIRRAKNQRILIRRANMNGSDRIRILIPGINYDLIKVLDGKTLPKEIGFEDDGSVTTDLPLTLPKLIKVRYTI